MAGNKKAHAVGIDLGTTYSCVATWQNNRVVVITNEQGNTTTPSCVAFTDRERLIGDAAKNQVAMNPTNTVFGGMRSEFCSDLTSSLSDWGWLTVVDIGLGLMAHRILRDVEAEADGWERSDFPIISKDTWCKIHDKYNSNQPVHQVLVTKASSRMLYVLFSGKRWIKNSGDGKGTAKALLDKIAGLEIEAQKSFMHRIAVFVDHPRYHRPGNPYGDIYGAFGDNQALRVDKDIQGSQDHSGRIDEEINGESMLWPEVAGK
ncbi:heat shock 70 kDa protein cognate 1-like protein [Tanacetum coccineum]